MIESENEEEELKQDSVQESAGGLEDPSYFHCPVPSPPPKTLLAPYRKQTLTVEERQPLLNKGKSTEAKRLSFVKENAEECRKRLAR